MTSDRPLRISMSQSALQAWDAGRLRGLFCSLSGMQKLHNLAQNQYSKIFLNFYLTRVYNVCMFDSDLNARELRRFNFWIEQKWIDRLKRDMKKHGHTTVAGFIRMIIIKFFDKGIADSDK